MKKILYTIYILCVALILWQLFSVPLTRVEQENYSQWVKGLSKEYLRNQNRPEIVIVLYEGNVEKLTLNTKNISYDKVVRILMQLDKTGIFNNLGKEDADYSVMVSDAVKHDYRGFFTTAEVQHNVRIQVLLKLMEVYSDSEK